MRDFIFDLEFLEVCANFSMTEKQVYELYPLIQEIIKHDKWQEIKSYLHHNSTRGKHILRVCCLSYLKSLKNPKYDLIKTVHGAMLHDFYNYDQKELNFDKTKLEFFSEIKRTRTLTNHLFIHPYIAYRTAKKYFPDLVDNKVANIILSHMWPIYPVTRPQYPESLLVNRIDKLISITDIFENLKDLHKFSESVFKSTVKQNILRK